jgi:hypothetical protein
MHECGEETTTTPARDKPDKHQQQQQQQHRTKHSALTHKYAVHSCPIDSNAMLLLDPYLESVPEHDELKATTMAVRMTEDQETIKCVGFVCAIINNQNRKSTTLLQVVKNKSEVKNQMVILHVTNTLATRTRQVPTRVLVGYDL